MPNATPPLSLVKRLRKVEALAKAGATPGERLAAQTRLESALEAKGLTLADIQVTKTRNVVMRYRTIYERKLLVRICYMLGIASTGVLGTARDRQLVAIDATKAQEVDLKAMFAFYKKAFANEIEVLMTAFVHRHSLYPPGEIPVNLDKISNEEQDTSRRALSISRYLGRGAYKKEIEL